MSHAQYMRLALRLARRGYGCTSPNPMVGAVLVRGDRPIGRGWHRRAGQPHAEIEAIRDATRRGHSCKGATLYVTLEPCCTQGRTPPCTQAIIEAGIQRVVVATKDPNPQHTGRGFRVLRRAGIEVVAGIFNEEASQLNEAFNHWIVRRTPLVTVKAAMTLDGKIATASGESKWITGEKARAEGMRLRRAADAILVGINTVLVDDPSLTVRMRSAERGVRNKGRPLRRIILDSMARTPLTARVVTDEQAAATTVVVTRRAPAKRVAALKERVSVWVAPQARSRRPGSPGGPGGINLCWLLRRLGANDITSLLVEGGGEVNASFLMAGLAQCIAFFYAPKVLGGRNARRAVAGDGAEAWSEVANLCDVRWRSLGSDLVLKARIAPNHRPG